MGNSRISEIDAAGEKAKENTNIAKFEVKTIRIIDSVAEKLDAGVKKT